MKVMLIAIVVLILAGCTQPDHARRVLETNGYKDIALDGYAWFECGGDDVYADRFAATSPGGQKVAGVVCAGLFFKGATIRFD